MSKPATKQAPKKQPAKAPKDEAAPRTFVQQFNENKHRTLKPNQPKPIPQAKK